MSGTYSVGLLIVENGITTVTLDGGLAIPVTMKSGDAIAIEGDVMNAIASITDPTHIELVRPFGGADQADASYIAFHMPAGWGDSVGLHEDIAEYLRLLGQGIVTQDGIDASIAAASTAVTKAAEAVAARDAAVQSAADAADEKDLAQTARDDAQAAAANIQSVSPGSVVGAATNAQAIAGTLIDKAMNPANTKAVLDDRFDPIAPVGYEDDLLGGDGYELDLANRIIGKLGLDLHTRHIPTKFTAPLDVSAGTTVNGATTLFLDGYEPDLCGYFEAVIDQGGRLIAGTPVSGGVGSSAEVTALNSAGDAAYVERVNASVLRLKTFDQASGVLHTIGADNAALNPAIDDAKRVVYWRNGKRYWQPIAGGTEHLFNATKRLFCLGDSMTAAGSGYGDLIGPLLPGHPVSNEGIYGQRADQIAARSGASAITGVVAGNSIPATTTGVAITGFNIALLAGTGNRSMKVTIDGIAGTLAWDGTALTNTFTRDVAGSAHATPNPASIVVTSGIIGTQTQTLGALLESTAILWAGRNDIGKVDYSQADVLASIAASVAVLTPFCSQFLIVGVTNGLVDIPISQGGQQSTDAGSKTRLDQIESLNAALAAEYEGRFVDMMAELATYNPALVTTYTVLGTDYVVLDATFSDDGLHGNAGVGRPAIAAVIAAKHAAKGW